MDAGRIRRVNRRDFIKFTSLAAAGVYVGAKSDIAQAMGGGGCGGGGCGGGGGGVIDPPIGALFKDPVEMPLTRANGIVTCPGITPQIARLPVNGMLTDLMTYNGSFPGPLVRLKRGEKWAMKFTNGLPVDTSKNILGFARGVTNIHTHGWHVSPSGMMDDVMRVFAPGQSGDYLYDTSLQPGGTLCWYHPHIHGLVGEQVWGGLHGTLVVEDETDAVLSGFETHVMVLKDIAVSGGKPAAYTSTMEYMQGKEGGTIMVNGQVNPVLTMRPGQVQRWRLLNASTARFYKLSLAGHTLQVVGTDGGLLDKPYPQSSMLLAPGERLDLLVKASTTAGTYKLLSLPYSRMGMMSSAQITLLTVSVSGTKVRPVAAERGQPHGDARDADGHAAGAQLRAQHEHGARLYQRPGLRCRSPRRRLRSDGRDAHVRAVDHHQQLEHGPPLAPTREPRAGAIHLGRRRGLRRVVHEEPGLEGRRDRAQGRLGQAAGQGRRLHRHVHVPLPHPGT